MEPLTLFEEIVILEIHNYLSVYERDPVNYTVLVFPPMERQDRRFVRNICELNGLVLMCTGFPHTTLKGVIVGSVELRNTVLQRRIQAALATGTYPKNIKGLKSGIVRHEGPGEPTERGIRFIAFGVQGFGTWPDTPRRSKSNPPKNLAGKSSSERSSPAIDCTGMPNIQNASGRQHYKKAPLIAVPPRPEPSRDLPGLSNPMVIDQQKSTIEIFESLHRYVSNADNPGCCADYSRVQANLARTILASIDELESSRFDEACGVSTMDKSVPFSKDEAGNSGITRETPKPRLMFKFRNETTAKEGQPNLGEGFSEAKSFLSRLIVCHEQTQEYCSSFIKNQGGATGLSQKKVSADERSSKFGSGDRSGYCELGDTADIENDIARVPADEATPIAQINMNSITCSDLLSSKDKPDHNELASTEVVLTSSDLEKTAAAIPLNEERAAIQIEEKIKNEEAEKESDDVAEEVREPPNALTNPTCEEVLPNEVANNLKTIRQTSADSADCERQNTSSNTSLQVPPPRNDTFIQPPNSTLNMCSQEISPSDPGSTQEEAQPSEPAEAQEEAQERDPPLPQEEAQHLQEYVCEDFINVAIVDEYAVEGSGMQHGILCPQKTPMEEHVRVCKVPASHMPNWSLYPDYFNIYPQQTAFYPDNFTIDGNYQHMNNGTTYYANQDNVYNATEYYDTVEGPFVNDTTSVNMPPTPSSHGVPAPAVDPISIAATSSQAQNMPFVSGYFAGIPPTLYSPLPAIAMPNSPGFVPCTTPIYNQYTLPSGITLPTNAYDEIPESTDVPLSGLIHIDGTPAQFPPVYDELAHQETPLLETLINSDYMHPGAGNNSEEHQRADAHFESNEYDNTYYYGPSVPQQRRTWTRRRMYPLPPDNSMFPLRYNVTVSDKATQWEPPQPTQYYSSESPDEVQIVSNNPPSPQRSELPEYFETVLQPPEEGRESSNKIMSSESSTVQLSSDRQQFPRSGVPGRAGSRLAENSLPSRNGHSNKHSEHIKERGIRNINSQQYIVDAFIAKSFLKNKASVTYTHVYRSSSCDTCTYMPYASDDDRDNLRRPNPNDERTDSTFDQKKQVRIQKVTNEIAQIAKTAREKNGYLPQQGSKKTVASTKNKKSKKARTIKSSNEIEAEPNVPDDTSQRVEDFLESKLFGNTVISTDSDTRSKDQPRRDEGTIAKNVKTRCDDIKENFILQTLPELAPPPQRQKSSNIVRGLIRMFEEKAKPDKH